MHRLHEPAPEHFLGKLLDLLRKVRAARGLATSNLEAILGGNGKAVHEAVAELRR